MTTAGRAARTQGSEPAEHTDDPETAEWAAGQNLVLDNPASELELPRREKRLPNAVLSIGEVEAALAQPNLENPGGLRDRAMHLQQIHAACHPGANNHLDRDDDTQAFLDAALSGVADGEVMSREELLAALKEEVDLENRPHPGEGRPWQLLEEGGFGIDTNSIRTSRTVFVPVVAGVKYLTLISTIARLHQHQRTKKTATIDGNAVTCIEATIGDIELANRLAADVLGR